MISNDVEFQQTLEQLVHMYSALAELRADVLPKNPSQFALMAEGPLTQIRILQQQVEEYSGAVEVEEHEAHVWLRIQSPRIDLAETPTSILTAFLDSFRKGVQSVAEYISTGHLTARPTKELKNACDLRVVALKPGSLRVGIRLPEQQGELWTEDQESPVKTALDKFVDAASWVGSEDEMEELERKVGDVQLRRVLLNAVKKFLPRPRGDVEFIELSGQAVSRTIQLQKTANDRINEAIDKAVAAQIETHTGDLREIDLDKNEFILRNTPPDGREVQCTFDVELLDIAKEALDRHVQASGIRIVEEGRRPPPLHVQRLEIIDEEEETQ